MAIKKITLNLNDESLQKLDAITASKFRGVLDRTKIIRWLIEDEWERMYKQGRVLDEKEIINGH